MPRSLIRSTRQDDRLAPLQLDAVDRGILLTLQEDARSTTAAEMGEQVGVSASTVRNRIGRLEEADVIEE